MSLVLVLIIFVCGGVVLAFLLSKKTKESGSEAASSSSHQQPTPETIDKSLRDAITGLYNRDHLLRRLQEVLARYDRNKERMALVLWDIDGFVEFNNRYSQKEGDEFLRKVAETIRRSIRIYDEAFRSGADEFCAILAPAEENIALEVTSRVRSAVEKSLFEGEAEYADQKFSISSGVVYYPSEHKVPEALLYAAREDLYKSRPHKKPTSA